MGGLAATAIAALDSLVGPIAASTCVRATALSLGKTAEDLGANDMPALGANIRRLLGPVAPENVVSELIREIEEQAR